MDKTLRDRITDSFADDDRESARQYIEWLRAATSELSASLRRTVTFLIVLIAAFEFITESPKSAYTIAGFRIDKGSIVLQIIPAVTAYLFFQVVADTSVIRRLQSALSNTMARWSPKARENDLDIMIGPPYPLFWTPFRTTRSRNIYPGGGVALFAAGIFGSIIILVFWIFEVQAYSELNQKHSGLSQIIWWCSLCFAIFCASMAYAYIQADMHAEVRHPNKGPFRNLPTFFRRH
jgi:hypothetical protein